jgi:glucose PTS system EIICB or EIICBA component
MLDRKNAFEVLQKIGRGTMLPVSILPVAGILLGLGGTLLSLHPESQNIILVLQTMKSAGDAIFAHLPLLFAIGVTLGLTKNDGASAVAALVGFVVYQGTLLMMGAPDTGVLGGIFVGYFTAKLFNRFHRTELPTYLGFFNGKRFVPIITAFTLMLFGVAMAAIWPFFQNIIGGFSQFASVGHPAIASFIYGAGERALLPFGLHHIWNVPFFFQAGDYTTATGELIHGELPRFFYGDPTAGILAGGYLYKMWGLPAAAFAMWQSANADQKKRVGAIMFAGALASFFSGITEPIEFSFLFIAPVLYGMHAVMAGLCSPLLYFLGVKMGFTFSPGAIDFGLFYVMGTKPWMILVLGPPVALIYYFVFRFAISKFNLRTPGREINIRSDSIVLPQKELARRLLAALGGRENLQSLDSCISRLRIELMNTKKAQLDELKKLGASGVLVVGNNLQVVFGTRSESIKNDIQDFIGTSLPPSSNPTINAPPSTASSQTSNATSETPEPIVDALGGAQNIEKLQLVAGTRLRVQVKDPRKMDPAALATSGMQAMTKIDDSAYHLIMGTNAPEKFRRISHLIASRETN